MIDWQNFLNQYFEQQRSEAHSADTLTANSNPDCSQYTYLLDLGYQGLMRVQGPDTTKFLQGQVTCDVRELANRVTRLGAQCSVKGRMLLSFRALQHDTETIFLRMHKGLIEKALASFGKYIVFSKAKLADYSDQRRNIGLCGVNADTLLKDVLGVSLDSEDSWQESSNNIVIKIAPDRYECWLAPEHAEKIWEQLATHCLLGAENLSTLLDIRAGLGEVRPETVELFTPQAMNYQLVNAINFRKGCYTGQEIVARLHYRGSLKRHMYCVEWQTEQPAELPLPGTGIFNVDKKNIGEIVIAAHSGKTSIEALANIADDQVSQAFVDQENPKKLEQRPLPYAIPSEENE